MDQARVDLRGQIQHLRLRAKDLLNPSSVKLLE